MTNDTLESEEIEPNVDNTPVIYMLSLFIVVGVIGNGLAICVFVRKKQLSHTIFILTLAVADILTCLFVIPFTIAMLTLNFRMGFDFPCKVYHFLITSNVPFSAFMMVAIAVERYVSVCHPFLRLTRARNTKITIAFLLLFASLLGLMTSLIYGVYQAGDAPCEDERNFTFSSSAFSYFHQSEAGWFSRRGNSRSPYNESVTGGEAGAEPSGVCFTGKCEPNTIIIDEDTRITYQRVLASLYLLSFLSTSVLYGLIYRYVFWRRAKRWKVKLKAAQSDTNDTIQMNHLGNLSTAGSRCVSHTNREVEVSMEKNGKRSVTQTLKDKNRFANFKLAVMLFVVNLVFVVAFLPAWLMAHDLIPYNPIFFYMYFSYNVANPLIYAFMNSSFREDMWHLLRTFRCKIQGNQYL